MGASLTSTIQSLAIVSIKKYSDAVPFPHIERHNRRSATSGSFIFWYIQKGRVITHCLFPNIIGEVNMPCTTCPYAHHFKPGDAQHEYTERQRTGECEDKRQCKWKPRPHWNSLVTRDSQLATRIPCPGCPNRQNFPPSGGGRGSHFGVLHYDCKCGQECYYGPQKKPVVQVCHAHQRIKVDGVWQQVLGTEGVSGLVKQFPGNHYEAVPCDHCEKQDGQSQFDFDGDGHA